MPTRDEITLAGMRFHALVGVLPHERQIAQPLEVDVSVRLDAALRDDAPRLDYRELYAAAAGVVASASHHDFLERAAERIAASALALAGVVGVRVAVRKPHVALGGPLGYAEVVIEREQPAGA